MFSRPLVRQVEARARQDAGFAQVLDELLLAPTTARGHPRASGGPQHQRTPPRGADGSP